MSETAKVQAQTQNQWGRDGAYNSGGDHKHEAHSKKKRATEAKLEFDFNPGKYRELFRHLDRPLSAQVELEFVPKLNGRRAVKVVSLKATA